MRRICILAVVAALVPAWAAAQTIHVVTPERSQTPSLAQTVTTSLEVPRPTGDMSSDDDAPPVKPLIASVPEPASLSLLSVAGLGWTLYWRRRWPRN